jgi:hypothetical protein
MKITPTVKIAGVNYTIRMIPYMWLEDECSGKTRNMRSIIDLEENMEPDIAKATLIHEIIEAIDTENQLKLKHHKIQSLATQLYQVIVDNPEMFKNE